MSKTILVIDYHSDIAEMLAFSLSLEKYTVKIARKKDEEVKILQETAELSCVLLDWREPALPLDSYVSEVRRIRPDIPVILLTDSPEVKQHAHELGIRCQVANPFDHEALLRELQDVGAEKADFSV
jgi:CheY-like chemotaxis protein